MNGVRGPTRGQRRVLEAIGDLARRTDRPASIREIMDVVGLASTSTVFGHLQKLQGKGLVAPSGLKPRSKSRVLTEAGRQALGAGE